MRLILIALLMAISYAQTAPATGAQRPMGGMNPYQWKMMDEAIDGFPDMGDIYGGFGDMGDMGFDLGDAFDAFDNGDWGDLMGYGMMFMNQLGGQGGQGVPNINLPFGLGNMQQLLPMLMTDNDALDDILDYAGDAMQAQAQMGMWRGGMGGFRQGAQLRMPRRHRQRPSRLLRKPRVHRGLHPVHHKLRKAREFWPFLYGMMNNANNAKTGQTAGQTAGNAMHSMLPWLGYDGIDSEDRAAMLMMGANPNSMPPPVDGIDGEDMWMYRGTRYDPMRWFNQQKTTTSTGSTGATDSNTDSTTTASRPTMPFMWPWWSSLQRPRHMKY